MQAVRFDESRMSILFVIFYSQNGAWCRGRTVTREFILSIINARKSVDLQARCYLQNLPDHILLTANSIAQQSPVVGCFGMFFS